MWLSRSTSFQGGFRAASLTPVNPIAFVSEDFGDLGAQRLPFVRARTVRRRCLSSLAFPEQVRQPASGVADASISELRHGENSAVIQVAKEGDTELDLGS